MQSLISSLVIGILLFLSLLHFYWVTGRQWSLHDALPQDDSGKAIFQPSRIASFMVGLGLLSMSFFFAVESQWIHFFMPKYVLKYAPFIIGGIFILRSIGDFNYVGFFKKSRNTRFAQKDTKFYSPLCLLLGLLIILPHIFR
ncbi:DUF3995 domain-containing protein [Saprospiraceae bacterium]|jgi:hypothetical protein|nr:DUF3995 domain-containing protein [Bacteroidota bacterium]MDB4727521.1 DUF3995 domain-containing protein [Saprospiraceae bacterium]MDF1867442.1 DUF3995 domain-containing protein [Saprospiraceae bacterium]